jgi:HlyD family secretion protein
MKSRKVVVRTVIAVIVAAGVYGLAHWWWVGRGGTETAEAAIETAEVIRGPIQQLVECTGKVVSNLDVEIKCRASGEVIKLPFDISDSVKKGDLLLELDPVDQQRVVQQNEAALSASKARLEQAKSTLVAAEKNLVADKQMAGASIESAKARSTEFTAKAKREEELMAKKYSSAEGMETARTSAVQAAQDLKTAQAQILALDAQEVDLETKRQQINLAKAEVDADTIALQLAQRQLGYCSVYAPIDGVVSSRLAQIGQIISSGISNVGGGTAVLTISDLSRMYILASVDEANIGFVQIGQDVDVTADSFPRKKFRGKVDRIAAKGVNLQNVVTFEVRVEVLSDNKAMLKPEMTTNVTIIIADKPEAILVPSGAIAREKGETFVTLASVLGGKGEKVPVQVGISNPEHIEITSGPEVGTKIIVQKEELDSRWRGGNDSSRQRMMMMRMGGGGSSSGGGGRGR